MSRHNAFLISGEVVQLDNNYDTVKFRTWLNGVSRFVNIGESKIINLDHVVKFELVDATQEEVESDNN